MLLIIVLLLTLNTVIISGTVECPSDDKWKTLSTTCYGDSSNIHVVIFAKIHRQVANFTLNSCSFSKAPELTTIDGANAQIVDVSVAAFYDLPRLKYLRLSFNCIEVLRKGFLSKTPALEVLDLSWNKLSRIENGTFEGLNLQVLNLSRNFLSYFKLEGGLLNLRELILSYNSLTTVDNVFSQLNGLPMVPRNMMLFDLSFNKIRHQPRLKCPSTDPCYIKILDLTHNELQFFSAPEMENLQIWELRLMFNHMRGGLGTRTFHGYYPTSFPVRRVSPYPNPWICNKGWTSTVLNLKTFEITIIPPETDSRFNVPSLYPVCAQDSTEGWSNYQNLVSRYYRHEEDRCRSDIDCQSSMLCRSFQCWDPCKFGACPSDTEICVVNDHQLSCQCPSGTMKQCTDFFSACSMA